MIRVVVIDDEEMIRSAIVSLLAMEDDLQVVGEAADGTTGLEVVRGQDPDVVLLDLEMPPTDGIDVATQVSRARTVLMTRHARPGVLRRAMAAGISGFVPKSSPVSTLADVIREVAAGKRYVDSDIAAAALASESCPLSERELDALRLTRRHLSVAQIAATLHLAEGTVRNYLSSAMTKTDTASRHEAADHAYEHGWI